MAYNKLEMLDDQGLGFTAKASKTVSGGELVNWFDGNDVVGSVVTTYAWNDFSIGSVPGANGNCIGIAISTNTSGNEIGFRSQGIFILPVGSTGISGGDPIIPAGYANMVIPYAQTVAGSVLPIGRSFTRGTALTGFVIVRLDA